MKYIQKLFDDVGLLASRKSCHYCKFVFDIVYPDQEKIWWPLGAQCRNCNEIIWFSSAESELLKMEKNKPNNIPGSGPQYVAWVDKIERQFLDSLPPCPNCSNVIFCRLITPGEGTRAINCPKCKKLNSEWESPSQDVTREYWPTRVWYLSENN